MIQQGQIYLGVSIAPGFVQIAEGLDLETWVKDFVLHMAAAQLDDEEDYLKNELHLTGKPDISQISVKYPINLEIQEDGSVKSCITVNVPYLAESSVKSTDKDQPLLEDLEI